MQHHGRHQIVDVGAVSQGQLQRLVLGAVLSDAAGTGDGGNRVSRGQQLDGLHDLGVAGAAAQVGTQPAVDGPPVQRRPLLVDESLCPDHDAGSAEPALQGAGGREAPRHTVPLHRIQPLDGRDLFSLHPGEGHLATNHRPTVHQHGTAPALSGRSASVLRREDPQLLPQSGQQVRMVAPDRDILPVETEGDGGRRFDKGHGLLRGEDHSFGLADQAIVLRHPVQIEFEHGVLVEGAEVQIDVGHHQLIAGGYRLGDDLA